MDGRGSISSSRGGERHMRRFIFLIVCLVALTSNLPLNTLWVEMTLMSDATAIHTTAAGLSPTIVLLLVYEICQLAPLAYFIILQRRKSRAVCILT